MWALLYRGSMTSGGVPRLERVYARAAPTLPPACEGQRGRGGTLQSQLNSGGCRSSNMFTGAGADASAQRQLSWTNTAVSTLIMSPALCAVRVHPHACNCICLTSANDHAIRIRFVLLPEADSRSG